MTTFDVVVVGAGAAGLLAATHAAERGRRTLLLEKSARPGLKILISGGGRCNVTTTKLGRELEAQFGARRGRFLRHALRAFQPPAVRAMFEAAGVALREEDLDKIFPVSQKARDVLDALLRIASAAGVELRRGVAVQDVERQANGFRLALAEGEVTAASVVLATGGLSYPKTGATGDGYPWLRRLGHTITPTFPALAPLVVETGWVRELAGIVLEGVDLSSIGADGKVITTRRRPVLFTHLGLSGPAPMDLSGDVEEAGGARVRFDFWPEQNREAIERGWLEHARRHGTQRAESLLPRELPERMRATLVELAGAGGTLANLAQKPRRRLLELVRGLPIDVPRSRGYAHAEVTRGGVALEEIDARTMQSGKVPGLFVCGELLDIDGPIGGFNFQAAFATGRLAGLHA
ncbi:MAG: NAD(P)/FAD-dependent oxidoreductase [bacterium]|nr:NAD(P)/FAD-dependent oxidoreductase [bacterium]